MVPSVTRLGSRQLWFTCDCDATIPGTFQWMILAYRWVRGVLYPCCYFCEEPLELIVPSHTCTQDECPILLTLPTDVFICIDTFIQFVLSGVYFSEYWEGTGSVQIALYVATCVYIMLETLDFKIPTSVDRPAIHFGQLNHWNLQAFRFNSNPRECLLYMHSKTPEITPCNMVSFQLNSNVKVTTLLINFLYVHTCNACTVAFIITII